METKRKADDVLQVINGLVEVLKEYDVKPDNFCITGSYALTTFGLNLNRELHDVDLYLRLNPETPTYQNVINQLRLMQYISGYVTPYDSNGKNTIAFDFRGMKVNIFMVANQFTFGFRTIHTRGGYHIDTIDHLLTKKMSLKRAKDYQDMNTIIKNLLSL